MHGITNHSIKVLSFSLDPGQESHLSPCWQWSVWSQSRPPSVAVSAEIHQVLASCTCTPACWQESLASTRISPCWISLESRMMEVVVTTGAIRRAKLQSNESPRTNQHATFFQARYPLFCPTNSVKALKENRDQQKCVTQKQNRRRTSFSLEILRRLEWVAVLFSHTTTSTMLSNITPHITA